MHVSCLNDYVELSLSWAYLVNWSEKSKQKTRLKILLSHTEKNLVEPYKEKQNVLMVLPTAHLFVWYLFKLQNICCSEVDNSIRVLRPWECEPLSAGSNMPITLALSMTIPFFAPMYNKLRNIYHTKYVMLKAYKI